MSTVAARSGLICALLAVFAATSCAAHTPTAQRTATVMATPVAPPPTSVTFVVNSDFTDTTVSYSMDDVAFTDRPLLGEKTWTSTVPLDPSNTTGVVVLNVSANPASGEDLGSMECSLYVEGRLFDRDYARVPVKNHDHAFVSCGSTVQAIQALTPLQP